MHRKLSYSLILAFLSFTSLNTIFFEVVKAHHSWVWVRNTVTGYYGEAVVGTGDAIYIARRNSFYRYNPNDNSWMVLAAPPNPDSGDAFKTGTALAWDFGGHIYVLYGAATPDSRRWFFRYSISQDSWEALANTTADQGEGDTIAWAGLDNCIYATIGGEQRPTYFIRYDPSTNSWSNTPANPPAGMGDGASLVWTGGNYMYALRGEFNEEVPLCDFWRYSLSGDVWTIMADIPADSHDSGVGGVGDGGSLLYVGFWLSNQTDYVYALSGNQAKPEKPQAIPDNRTYRYSISLNSWERLVDLPFGVGHYVGCRLGYADGHIYAWQGTPSTWEGGGDDLAYYVFPIPEPEYILEISSTVGGATNPAPGTYTYSEGTEATVTATSDENYSFDHWELDGENAGSQNPIAITMDANHTLHAVFNPILYYLSIYAVERPSGTTDPPAGTHSFIAGTTLNVTALPDPGFSFHYWSFDGEEKIENPITIVMDMNHTLIPYFIDDISPEIGAPIQEPPENIMAYQNVTVTVDVTDLGTGVRNVTLWYSINNRTTWTPLNMPEIHTDIYQATIPGHENCTWITYKIIAYDNNGNPAINDNNGYHYIYHIIPEFPSFLILLSFMITTFLGVIVYRRKHLM